MTKRRKYLRRSDAAVIAVQLDLDTEGFTYQKWGARQTCKPGDWLVNNGGDVYTVDGESFAKTYRAVGPGIYAKFVAVWAEVADQDGQIATKEGITHYTVGSYLVFNDPEGHDGYAMPVDTFVRLYEIES